MDQRDGGKRPGAGRRRQIAGQRARSGRAGERRRRIGDDDAPLGGRGRARERQGGEGAECGGETAADGEVTGALLALHSPCRAAEVSSRPLQVQASQAVPKASVTRVSGRPTLK